MAQHRLRAELTRIRSDLSPVQSELLRRLCSLEPAKPEQLKARLLFHSLSPIEARAAIADLIPSAVLHINGAGEDYYQATLLGHLLNGDTSLVDRLADYLRYIGVRYRDDAGIQEIHSDDLRMHYDWDKPQAMDLYRSVSALGVHGGTGQGGGAWHAIIPPNVDVVAALSDHEDAVLRLAFGEVTPSTLLLSLEPAPPTATDQPKARTQIRLESVRAAAASDQPSAIDHMGYAPYVSAVADFLANTETAPPLAMSVEGAWGSGKSSFLIQLERSLHSRGLKTVEFNAWRHDKSESMWASFALECLRSLQRQLGPWWKRVRASVTLVSLRYSWTDVAWGLVSAVLRVALFLAVMGALAAFLIGHGLPSALDLIGITGPNAQSATQKTLFMSSAWLGWALVSIIGFLRIRAFVGDPIASDLGKYVANPRYGDYTSFLEHFHRDFSRILSAYLSQNERLVVFIDDLDRCDSARASDLLQAIHLMIADDPRVMFVIGMDRDKVALAVATRHDAVAPAAKSEAGEAGSMSVAALEYGYAYVEKLIQVPLRLPEPRAADVARFVKAVSRTATVKRVNRTWARPRWLRAKALEERKEGPLVEAEDVIPSLVEHTHVSSTVDSGAIQSTVTTLAPFLQNNPRRLKRFLNVLRLRTYIASKTGLFAGPAGSEPPLGIEQLGKLIVLEFRWPSLLRDIGSWPMLLGQLEVIANRELARDQLTNGARLTARDWAPAGPPATDEELAVLRRWSVVAELRDVLRAGMRRIPQDIGSSPWSVAVVEARRVLEIAPAFAAKLDGRFGMADAAEERAPQSGAYYLSESEREALMRDPNRDMGGGPEYRSPMYP